jgi:hypothetical protein
VIAAVIFWPQSSVDPAPGLDPSWDAGWNLAWVHHLAAGREVLYEPLGFLWTTAYYSFNQSVLASIYQPITVAAVFLGVAATLRQRHVPMTSLIGAFVTTGIVATLYTGHGGSVGMIYPELAIVAAFAWAAVPVMQQDPKRSAVFTTCIVLGAVAGLELLMKYPDGLAILVIAVAVSVLLDWRAVGRHCATVTAFAAATLICWVLAGQRPGDLPAWLRYTADSVSNYDAMAVPMPLSPGAVIPVVLTLAWIAALCVMFVRGGQKIPRRFVVLVGIVTVLSARHAFARLDVGHFNVLLGVIVVAVVIAPLSGILGRALVVVVVATVFLELSNEALVMRALGKLGDSRIAATVQAPGQAVDRLVTLALPGRFGQRVERAKARQRAFYAVPDRFIKTIGSGTVHIDPDETSAAWAYDLAWRPVPVFVAVSAYTPTLDELNSESLAAGPQFVLSRLSSASPATDVDDRLGVQESPRYSRALLCNFTVSGVENRWTLFTHTGPHCGPLTALSQVDVRGNDVITIPAPSRPDMAVLVGIDLEPTVTDRLFQGAVAPLTISTVALDGVTYRLITANAAEPFLVKTPASVAGTNLQIHAHTIGVGRAPSLGQGGVAARLRFYEMRVEP